ncbi:MAG: hypothetical protein AMXMBFR4_18970 [Candidatus Hydrogenedentota bacterium]
MVLTMAAEALTLWVAVSAWCGISDLGAWQTECRTTRRKYGKDIEGVVGGAPGSSSEVDKRLSFRSPLFSIRTQKDVPPDSLDQKKGGRLSAKLPTHRCQLPERCQ